MPTELRFVALATAVSDDAEWIMPLHVHHVPLDRALLYAAHVNERPHPYYRDARLALKPVSYLPFAS